MRTIAFTAANLLIVAALFGAMLGVLRLGRRIGERHRLEFGEVKAGAAEGAVFALLGLFFAFSFSGAGARFDTRRHLVVSEANAIGTAWLRLDLLPADRQPHMRDLFRQYLDARLAFYRVDSPAASVEAQAAYTRLQQDIWSAAVAGANATGQTPAFTVLLPALNQMIDIATTRQTAIWIHPPIAVFGMIGVLALIGALFVGYGMAGNKGRSWIHAVGFAGVLTLTMYVIVDLEFPRLGLIRVDAIDQVLIDLRRSMN